MFNFITLLLISTLSLETLSTFRNVFSTTFSSKPLFLQFSLNQKYLACGSESQIDIYNGLTLVHIQTFPLENGEVLKGLDFSKEQDRIVFGFQESDGSPNYEQTFLLRKDDTQSNNRVQNHKYDEQNMTVSGICYSANSSNIVIGFLENVISLRSDNSLSNFIIDQPVIKIICSPTIPEVFAIISTNKIVVFEILELNSTNSTMVRVFEQQFKTTPSDMSYNDDRLCVSVNDTVHVYQTTNYTKLSLHMIGNFQLNRVIAAKDIFGVSAQGRVFLQNYNKPVSETIENVESLFALPYNGYNLLTMSSEYQANLLTKCQQTQYFDSTSSTCVSCSDKYKCSSCRFKEKCQACLNSYILNSQGVCNCPSGKYDSNKTCQLCPKKCKSCTSEVTCQSCSDPFIKPEQNCICPDTTYQFNTICTPCIQNCLLCKNNFSCEKCKDGFDFEENSCKEEQKTNVVLIVLLICAGVVIIGAIIGIIIFQMKRKSKKRFLEDSEDEGNEVKTFN